MKEKGRLMGEIPTIDTRALDRAMAQYPYWVRDALRTWIRDQEARGQRFASAAAAVSHALKEA